MKPIRKEELRALSARLYSKGSEVHITTAETIEQYQSLAEQLGHGPAINDALAERSQLLISQGRYGELLQLYENRLGANPFDIGAQRNWRYFVGEIHTQMLRLSVSAPETAEYGRTYEKLLQIGYVGSLLHLGAVRHYLACGQLERAVERLLLLAQVGPGAPGVAELLARVAEVTDDVRIQQLQITFE